MVTVNPSRGRQQKHKKVTISDQRCDGSTNPHVPQRQSLHIRVQNDNEAAVSVLRSGHAHDTVIQDCAKAALLVQALIGVDIIYYHILGDDNDMADALSLLDTHRAIVDSMVQHYGLQPIPVCVHCVH